MDRLQAVYSFSAYRRPLAIGLVKECFREVVRNLELPCTMAREENFNIDDRNRMFLSSQTYKGLKITVNSHVEVSKFLLAEAFEYVLTERLMQNVVEDYFGYQREKGIQILLLSNLDTQLIKEIFP